MNKNKIKQITKTAVAILNTWIEHINMYIISENNLLLSTEIDFFGIETINLTEKISKLQENKLENETDKIIKYKEIYSDREAQFNNILEYALDAKKIIEESNKLHPINYFNKLARENFDSDWNTEEKIFFVTLVYDGALKYLKTLSENHAKSIELILTDYDNQIIVRKEEIKSFCETKNMSEEEFNHTLNEDAKYQAVLSRFRVLQKIKNNEVYNITNLIDTLETEYWTKINPNKLQFKEKGIIHCQSQPQLPINFADQKYQIFNKNEETILPSSTETIIDKTKPETTCSLHVHAEAEKNMNKKQLTATVNKLKAEKKDLIDINMQQLEENATLRAENVRLEEMLKNEAKTQEDMSSKIKELVLENDLLKKVNTVTTDAYGLLKIIKKARLLQLENDTKKNTTPLTVVDNEEELLKNSISEDNSVPSIEENVVETTPSSLTFTEPNFSQLENHTKENTTPLTVVDNEEELLKNSISEDNSVPSIEENVVETTPSSWTFTKPKKPTLLKRIAIVILAIVLIPLLPVILMYKVISSCFVKNKGYSEISDEDYYNEIKKSTKNKNDATDVTASSDDNQNDLVDEEDFELTRAECNILLRNNMNVKTQKNSI